MALTEPWDLGLGWLCSLVLCMEEAAIAESKITELMQCHRCDMQALVMDQSIGY